MEKQIAALTFHDEIWGANILNTLAQYGDAAMLVPLLIAVSIIGTLGLVVLVTRWHIPTLGAAALAGVRSRPGAWALLATRIRTE